MSKNQLPQSAPAPSAPTSSSTVTSAPLDSATTRASNGRSAQIQPDKPQPDKPQPDRAQSNKAASTKTPSAEPKRKVAGGGAARRPAGARPMDEIEERIQQRAYELWESEGRPHGREQTHWQLAEREIVGHSRNGRA